MAKNVSSNAPEQDRNENIKSHELADSGVPFFVTGARGPFRPRTGDRPFIVFEVAVYTDNGYEYYDLLLSQLSGQRQDMLDAFQAGDYEPFGPLVMAREELSGGRSMYVFQNVDADIPEPGSDPIPF